MRIAKFIGELDSGFRLLNLKNDGLRKRYDGLKYDLQKIEMIIYDVKIRKLVPLEVNSIANGEPSENPQATEAENSTQSDKPATNGTTEPDPQKAGAGESAPAEGKKE